MGIFVITVLLFVVIIGGSAYYFLALNPFRTGQDVIDPTPTATPKISPTPFSPSITPTPTPSPHTTSTPTTQPQSPTTAPSTSSPTVTVTASPTTAPTTTPTLVPTNPPTSWKPVDLNQAVVDGLVNVTISGNSLQRIDITLRSKSNEPLEVTIRSGTLFQSQSAGVQNMVVIAPKVVYLESPEAVVSVVLDAACASMELDQPQSSNAFSLGGSIQADLVLLLNSSSFASETFRVKQFAIWTITDNPPRNGYVGLGTGVIGSGPSDAEIVRIRTLFVAAGISTDKYTALL